MALIWTLLHKSGLYVAKATVPEAGKPEQAVVVTTTRVVSLKQLTGDAPAVVSGPKGFQATPADVFAAAKLPEAPGGWTAERMLELARKPVYKDMNPETRQMAVLAELATQSADAEAIVGDAVRKDQALDAYERFLQKKLEETRKEAAARKAALEKELAAVDAMVKATEKEMAAWVAAKRTKEAELAEALEPLLAHGKISKS